VSAHRTRRRFTAAYKRTILCETARCSQSGDLAALLRREGLYSSHLAAWRAAERRGELAGPTKRRGPTATPVDPHTKRVAELERQLAKATARAERAEGLVALQKKVAELFGQTLDTPSEPR
jgi:transposase